MSDIREKLQNKIDGISNTTNVTNNKVDTINKTNDIRSKLQSKIVNTNSIQNTTSQKSEGNFFQKAGSTIGDFATNIGRGFLNTLEGVVDLGRYGVAGVADFFGADKYANEVRERAKQDTTSQILKPADDLYNQHSVLKENGIIEGVAQGIGNVGSMIGGGALLGKAGTIGKYIPTTSLISGAGSGMTEAYNNGATNGQAIAYGALSGLTESLSEAMFSGLGSKFSKIYGGGALDDVLIKNVTNKISNKTVQTLVQSGLKATGEGFEEIISGLGDAFAKKITYMNDEQLTKLLSDEDLLNSFVIGSLTSAVMQTPGTINSIKTGNDYISNGNTQNSINALLNNKTAENSSNYKYIPTNNDKSNKLKQSASQYFNDSIETISMINTIDKVIQDKGYNVLFDNSIVNQNGQSVNAQIKTLDNGELEIKINPNSSRAGEFLLTHEITHAIETDSMKQLVIDYASKHSEFNEALENLKQTYGTTDVSSEVLADISGQLFGNQEFIINLSTEKPNVFKKIYNKIVELANKITGSKESLFIRDLKNKWEEAYRTQSNNLDSNRFSIQTDINGNKYVNVDTDQDIFEGKNLAEQTKIAKQYILDNFRQNGIDVNNENINVTSKTANEYTHPKNQLPVATKTSKMKASTELDNLLSTSEYKYSKSDDGRHPFAKDGWDYYETTFKVGDNLFTGLVNIGKNGNKKTLYDITNIKRIDQNRGTSANAFSTSLVNSSIDNVPQSDTNVNTSSTKYSMQENINNTQELDNSSFSLKQKQLDIILENNPAEDNYHTWIRNIDDIKTFEETLEDSDYKEYYEAGGDFDETYTANMAKTALETGKITVYSSYPIEQGIFVSPSQMEASQYAGGDTNKLYSKEVNLSDVAWIDPTQGQYAKIDTKYSQQNDKWQEYVENNYKSTGTRTNMQSLGLPTANKQEEKVGTIPKKEIPQDPTKESSYDNINKKTRKQVGFELLNEMGINEQDIAVGNDINSIDLSRTDPIRVNEKVFGAKIGKKINDATINKTKHNEAERTRWLNKERNEIAELGIKARSKESAAVQKYGEKQYIAKNNEVIPYGDNELAKEFPNIEIQNKIKKASQIIRNKYDNCIEQINDVLVDMGYNPIKKRPDYMRHFQALNDVFSRFGTPLNAESMQNDSLPTDINGLTDQFKPGKQYFANAMQRMGLKTEYDAITGIDGYLDGASNLIFHTEDIQRYRTLSKFVRDTYGSKNGYEDFATMTVEEQEQRIADIQSNKLSKYAAWLDEQANALAGKKRKIDRGIEDICGRKIYNILDTAKKQVGSNMVGFNIRSALTNFASAVQGASKTNKLAFVKGTVSAVNNLIHKDSLVDKSDFLTSRFGSKNLSQKMWQKASNAGQFLMEGSDYFTANQIWRSKYYENLSKGMNETQAIKNADDFSSRIMGDRSKGSTAAIFNSKTLGLFTQFQLEVNNQWSSMIHDNKMDIQNGNKTSATILFQMGQLAAMSYMFNNLMKSLTGSAVMLDPIDLLKKIFNPDDDDKTPEERANEVLGNIVDNLPFANLITPITGLGSGGRIPISEAFKGVKSIPGVVFGSEKDEYGNYLSRKESLDNIIDASFYWLLPTGYGQAKKTAKGLSMYKSALPTPGSYTNSGNLRFTADESTGGKIKATLFGQYSSKEAQDYIDSGYKSISKNDIQEMKDLGMTSSEYREYKNKLNSYSKTTDEKNYQKYENSNGTIYWYDKNNKVLYDDEYNKVDIYVTTLNKVSESQLKFEYISNLDVSEKQKQIMFQNALGANTIDKYGYQKYKDASGNVYWYDDSTNSIYDSDYKISNKKIDDLTICAEKDFSNYKNYSSYEELNYAYQYPEKYSLITQITNYDDYNKYKEEIDELRKNTEGTNKKKSVTINYINSLKLSIPQKAIFIKMYYSSFDSYDNDIVNYLNNQNLDYIDKAKVIKNLGITKYDNDIINYVRKNYKTVSEQKNILETLGFKVYTSNGKTYVKKG